MNKYVAEFVGTAVLVVFGCGSAVAANTLLANAGQHIQLAFSTLLIAFAFGLSIVAMAYSIGNISGCHINPAVSFGMLVAKRMTLHDFVCYVIAQFLGATAGAAILVVMFGSNAALGTNGYGSASALGISMSTALLVEVVLTFVFVIAILGVTSKPEFSSVAGLVIGLTLTLVHILGIPFHPNFRQSGQKLWTGNFKRWSGFAAIVGLHCRTFDWCFPGCFCLRCIN